MLVDSSVGYWWTAAAVTAVVFWATMVHWLPTRRTRWQMALLPVLLAPLMLLHLAAERVSLVVMLLAYVVVLAALIVTVLPFRGPLAQVMGEDAKAGRDPRARKLGETPRGVAMAVIVAAMILTAG